MRALIRLLFVGAALCMAGCASWPPRWLSSVGSPQKDPFTGDYEGTWASSRRASSGGRLQCRLQRVKTGHYHADFRAFWHGLNGGYPVELKTREEGGCLYFEGEQKLPKIQGGIYRYSGMITGSEFNACYDSKYDTGEFKMRKETGN